MTAPTLELLSVHVPKCAGSSLGVALERLYSQSLLQDYGDRPGDPASPMNLDPDGFLRRAHAALPGLLHGKRAVHGHFQLAKYQPVRAAFRTAIIREPLSRLVSHFYYWKNSPRERHSLHDYFLDQQLDLESFARLPFIRYFYTRVFFAGLNATDFDYIGTVENMPAALAMISRNLSRPLSVGVEKKRTGAEYQEGLAQLEGDSALRGRLATLLAEDIRFYDSVRNRWA